MDTEALSGVVKRLRRAEGQIGRGDPHDRGGRHCAEIVTQLAAVSKALDRAGFAVIATCPRQCLTQNPDGSEWIPQNSRSSSSLPGLTDEASSFSSTTETGRGQVEPAELVEVGRDLGAFSSRHPLGENAPRLIEIFRKDRR